MALIFAVVAFHMIDPARGDSSVCSTMSLPEISVDVVPAALLSSTISLDQLRQISRAANHVGPIVGAYSDRVRYKADIDSTTEETHPGRYCPTPKFINVKLQLDQTIYIPTEFSSDACLLKLARGHEEKFAAAEVTALEGVHEALLTAVRNTVLHYRISPASSKDEAPVAFAHEVHAAIDRVLDEVEHKRVGLSSSVNTPEELEHLRLACDGRALIR